MIKFLEKGKIPLDSQEAKRTKRLAPNYMVQDGLLYKRGRTHPNQRCLGPTEARKVLEEIHAGYCGSHIGGKTLAHMVLCQGYY